MRQLLFDGSKSGVMLLVTSPHELPMQKRRTASSGGTKADSSLHLLTGKDYVTGRFLPVAGSRAEEKPTSHKKKEEASEAQLKRQWVVV